MADVLLLFGLFCVIGILTEEISLGLVFILSLGCVLYTALLLIQKKRLSQIGMLAVVLCLLSLAYAVCVLFLHIDLRTILNLDAIL